MRRRGGMFPKFLLFSAIAAIAFSLIADKAWAQPEFTFHGEFRINSYADSRDDTTDFGDGNRIAARLRWRPTIDVKVSDTVSLHTQFNIGPINDNFFNHRTSTVQTRDPALGSGAPAFGLRQAYIVAGLPGGVTGIAGLVPVPDKVGRVLFDSDWEFSPLALAFLFKVGEVNVRAGIAKADEGSERDKAINADGQVVDNEDDYNGAVLDLDWGPFGASVYSFFLQEQATRNITGFGCGSGGPCLSAADVLLMYYAVRYSGEVGGIKVNAVAMVQTTDAPNLFANLVPAGTDAGLDTTGFAGKLEVIVPVSDMTLSVMGWYASGDKDNIKPGGDADAFLTPMSLVGLTGYWGYTGKLNVQGSTDTGIDEHMVNIDGGSVYNNSQIGQGLVTLQAKLDIPINDMLGGVIAAAWMQSADTPAGVSDNIGFDVFAQGTWHIGEHLNLDFGVDYLAMDEGHYAAVQLDGTRASRNITTVFSRLQLAY